LGGSSGCFTSGVTGTYNNYIVLEFHLFVKVVQK
jgi:hypothetical protein